MIVYLDQNKWIELARAINHIDTSQQADVVRRGMPEALKYGCVFPISSVHIIEFSRIKKDERRSRLGTVMWDFSQGITTAPLSAIIRHELEEAFSKEGYAISPTPFDYLDRGIAHAFGTMLGGSVTKMFPALMDKAMLCGYEDIPPMAGGSRAHRENFSNHLATLRERAHDLKKSERSNFLYAISMCDILGPLNDVLSQHHIPNIDLENWGVERLSAYMEGMPTRAVDIHLHRQVLKNPEYKPKQSDLEDWGGLGPAACYADIVICEKHFADMLKRDGFKTKARIETSLSAFVQEVALS